MASLSNRKEHCSEVFLQLQGNVHQSPQEAPHHLVVVLPVSTRDVAAEAFLRRDIIDVGLALRTTQNEMILQLLGVDAMQLSRTKNQTIDRLNKPLVL